MFISDQIKKDARSLLEKGVSEFPAQIPGAPAFYLDKSDRDTLQAFGGIVYEGQEYMIGTLK